MSRLRVVSYMVQPVFMLDDGENLTPWPPPDDRGQPQQVVLTIPAAEWPAVVEHLAGAVEQLRQQAEGPPPEPEPEPEPTE